ncbi:LytTR family transcriptional regulator DNA-binding domain-containing protein [Spirosoma litoris]
MKRKRKSFHIRKGAHIRTQLAQILYLIGDINYSRIHLVNGEVILMSRTLKWYEGRWPSFIRIHKQTLINPNYARSFILSSTLREAIYVVMADSAKLLIARRRLSLIRKKLACLHFGKELHQSSRTPMPQRIDPSTFVGRFERAA